MKRRILILVATVACIALYGTLLNQLSLAKAQKAAAAHAVSGASVPAEATDTTSSASVYTE
ncbi:MAG: hypothetical protein MJ178_04515 [Treponemataceae bacterium]|nr:hypothetical protein [Treponemataceae bacterium]